jgi:hypothetical protein
MNSVRCRGFAAIDEKKIQVDAKIDERRSDRNGQVAQFISTSNETPDGAESFAASRVERGFLRKAAG